MLQAPCVLHRAFLCRQGFSHDSEHVLSFSVSHVCCCFGIIVSSVSMLEPADGSDEGDDGDYVDDDDDDDDDAGVEDDNGQLFHVFQTPRHAA